MRMVAICSVYGISIFGNVDVGGSRCRTELNVVDFSKLDIGQNEYKISIKSFSPVQPLTASRIRSTPNERNDGSAATGNANHRDDSLNEKRKNLILVLFGFHARRDVCVWRPCRRETTAD